MSRILYWPGMGQDLKILENFRKQLRQLGNIVDVIDFDYDDNNKLNPNEWKIINNKYDWWIGLSLGASLVYYSYEYVEDKNKPERITIINPFSSRKKLSIEKQFDLKNQWDFSPICSNVDIEKIDLVRSIYDDKIPSYHGFELLNNSISNNKNFILVKDKHTIDNIEAQKELARLLIKEENKNEPNYYCNIYKQK